ncbi:cohesin domain-containing protein [Herbivorax sp. ANBcel31]|uniref:cohesin domain-containing protein n=1 Tax=Herbivorax sp. ANBcel31 TaxID=3069754 RepID=UPI0027B1F030|nr:cohesin domain-containing protein [Herbivorax sp. ANBcel31]MDQ2087405.1 cohesin domain-containing protein [Herbivorax sp. ANBcel31]
MFGKKKMKVSAFVVAIMFLVTCLTTVVQAEIDTEILTSEGDLFLEVGEVSASSGESVVIPVKLLNVPIQGINNCDFRLNYNADELDIIDVSVGDIVEEESDFYFNCNEEEGKLYFLFHDETGVGSRLILEDGIFFEIEAQVKSTAENDIIPITMGDLDYEFADYDLNRVSLEYIEGGIVLEKDDIEKEVLIEIGEVSGVKGDIVEIPIELSKVPEQGILAFNYSLEFDEQDIEIIDAVPGGIVGVPEEDMQVSVCNNDGALSFLFCDYTDGDRMIMDKGKFVTIIAEIKNETDKFSAIKLPEYDDNFPDMCFINFDLENFSFEIIGGGVNIERSFTMPEDDTLLIMIDDVKGVSGEIVDVPIMFLNVPSEGIGVLDFTIEYDNEKLEVIDVEIGELAEGGLPGLDYNNRTDVGRLPIIFEERRADEVITEDGEFANLRVKIKSEDTGEIVPIVFDNIGPFANYDLNEYPLISQEGKVTVIEEVFTLDRAEIDVKSVSGKPGDLVEIPVILTNMPKGGMSNQFEFSLNYNSSDIEVVSIESVYDETLFETYLNDDKITCVFFEDSETYQEGDELAKITAKINEEAETGFSKIYDVTTEGVHIIYPLAPIRFNNGGVMIEESLTLGDINGDGEIDSTDYVLLQRYVLEIIDEFPNGVDPYKVADINGDGEIDSTDYILLKRYVLKITDEL